MKLNGKTLAPIFEDREDLAELYIAILDNYRGIGFTPRGALEGIADDLKHGRLTSQESLEALNCSMDEMLVTMAYIIEHFAQYAPDEMVTGNGHD